MDPYVPQLLALGLKAMIGKGKRSPEVIAAMIAHKAVYLGAVGGAGALISQSIKAAEIIAYEDLGPKGIKTCGRGKSWLPLLLMTAGAMISMSKASGNMPTIR